MGILPASMSVSHVSAWRPWRPEVGVRSSGTGYTRCQPPCGCKELNPGPLEEPSVLGPISSDPNFSVKNKQCHWSTCLSFPTSSSRKNLKRTKVDSKVHRCCEFSISCALDCTSCSNTVTNYLKSNTLSPPLLPVSAARPAYY